MWITSFPSALWYFTILSSPDLLVDTVMSDYKFKGVFARNFDFSHVRTKTNQPMCYLGYPYASLITWKTLASVFHPQKFRPAKIKHWGLSPEHENLTPRKFITLQSIDCAWYFLVLCMNFKCFNTLSRSFVCEGFDQVSTLFSAKLKISNWLVLSTWVNTSPIIATTSCSVNF